MTWSIQTFTCDMHGPGYGENQHHAQFLQLIGQEPWHPWFIEYPEQLGLNLKTPESRDQPEGCALHTENKVNRPERQLKEFHIGMQV